MHTDFCYASKCLIYGPTDNPKKRRAEAEAAAITELSSCSSNRSDDETAYTAHATPFSKVELDFEVCRLRKPRKIKERQSKNCQPRSKKVPLLGELKVVDKSGCRNIVECPLCKRFMRADNMVRHYGG